MGIGAWVSALQADLNGVVAIDGKTLRRACNKPVPQQGGRQGPASHDLRLRRRPPSGCGQRQVDGTSNAIAAIPGRLDVLHIEGALATLVTIDAMGCHPTHDAMGCHRAIAGGILDRGGQYVVALKGNQRALHGDVELFLAEQGACDHADTAVTCHETMENNHDRLETGTLTVCTLTVCDDVEWLAQRHNRP